MSGIYHQGRRIGTVISLSIEQSDGAFREIGPVRRTFRDKIVCSPVSGRDGIEYVPDWHGITHHG